MFYLIYRTVMVYLRKPVFYLIININSQRITHVIRNITEYGKTSKTVLFPVHNPAIGTHYLVKQ